MDTFFHNILSTVLKSLYREKTRAIFSTEVIFQHVYWIFGKTLRCPENRFPSLYSKTNKLFKDTHRQKHYLQIRLQRFRKVWPWTFVSSVHQINSTAWKVSQYWVFSGRHFPTEYRKVRTTKNSVFGHFSRSALYKRFWNWNKIFKK